MLHLPLSFSFHYNCKEGAVWPDFKRAVLSEEGGTAATIEGLVPPSNYIANKNEDSEEGGIASTVE